MNVLWEAHARLRCVAVPPNDPRLHDHQRRQALAHRGTRGRTPVPVSTGSSQFASMQTAPIVPNLGL
jgi:hypothetical protein